ncbi:unnamed protein product [Neospora caninum Liverpool]|uniref:AP2/ERF domain-containing protein n=1 Tax=Neospora caninum (strain Liverpool) TaxID=572307 RepID=F0V7W5_NEOCL|nr:uncharacterized protein NCLIV_002930 [Neospora caninum Liverpool]CBZ49806.1 unnamed protein product [Neospora caninum Liverpool]|eukprot:XP_003879841.1 uncharacterized protein NCLIV_002930 [Neospora caninum Liverpool]
MTGAGSERDGCSTLPSGRLETTAEKLISGDDFPSLETGVGGFSGQDKRLRSAKTVEWASTGMDAASANQRDPPPVLPLLKEDQSQALSSMALWQRRLPTEIAEGLQPFPPTPRTPTLLRDASSGAISGLTGTATGGDETRTEGVTRSELRQVVHLKAKIDVHGAEKTTAATTDLDGRELDRVHNVEAETKNEGSKEAGRETHGRAPCSAAPHLVGGSEDAEGMRKRSSFASCASEPTQPSFDSAARGDAPVEGVNSSRIRPQPESVSQVDSGVVSIEGNAGASLLNCRLHAGPVSTPVSRAQEQNSLQLPQFGKEWGRSSGLDCGGSGDDTGKADVPGDGSGPVPSGMRTKDADVEEPAGEELWNSIGKPVSAALSCSLSSAILKSKKQLTVPQPPPLVRSFICRVFAAQLAHEKALLLQVFVDALPRLEAEIRQQRAAALGGDASQSPLPYARNLGGLLSQIRAGEEASGCETPGQAGTPTADVSAREATFARIRTARGNAGHLALQLKHHLLSLVSYLQQRVEGGSLSANSTSPNTPSSRDGADPLATLGSSAVFGFHKRQLYEAEIALLPRECVAIADGQANPISEHPKAADANGPGSVANLQSSEEPQTQGAGPHAESHPEKQAPPSGDPAAPLGDGVECRGHAPASAHDSGTLGALSESKDDGAESEKKGGLEMSSGAASLGERPERLLGQVLGAEEEVLRGLPACMVNYLLIFMDVLVLLCVDPSALATAAAAQMGKRAAENEGEGTSQTRAAPGASGDGAPASSDSGEGEESGVLHSGTEILSERTAEGASADALSQHATPEPVRAASAFDAEDEGKETMARGAHVILSVAVEVAMRGALRSLEELRSVHSEKANVLSRGRDEHLLLLEHVHRDFGCRPYGGETIRKEDAVSPSTASRARTPGHRDSSTCAASTFSSSSSVGSWGPDASPRAAVGTDEHAFSRNEQCVSHEAGRPLSGFGVHDGARGAGKAKPCLDSQLHERGSVGHAWDADSPGKGKAEEELGDGTEPLDPESMLFFAPLYSSIPPSCLGDEDIPRKEKARQRWAAGGVFPEDTAQGVFAHADGAQPYFGAGPVRPSRLASLEELQSLWGDLLNPSFPEGKSAWQASTRGDASPPYSFLWRKERLRETLPLLDGDCAPRGHDGKFTSRSGEFSARSPVRADTEGDAGVLFAGVPSRASKRTRLEHLDEDMRNPAGQRGGFSEEHREKGDREEGRETLRRASSFTMETRRRRAGLVDDVPFSGSDGRGAEWPNSSKWRQRDPREASGRRLYSQPCSPSCEGCESCLGLAESAEDCVESRVVSEFRKERLGFPGAGSLAGGRASRGDGADEASSSPVYAGNSLLPSGRSGSASPACSLASGQVSSRLSHASLDSSCANGVFSGASGARRTGGQTASRRGVCGSPAEDGLMHQEAGIKAALGRAAGSLRSGGGDPTAPQGAGSQGAKKTSLSAGSRRGQTSGAHGSAGDSAGARLTKAGGGEANGSPLDAEEMDTGHDTRRPMRGVYFDKTQRSWIGSFYEDRRQIKKRFKIDTYGFHEARALAIGVRMTYERRMRNAENSSPSCGRGANEVPGLARTPAKALASQASEGRNTRAGTSAVTLSSAQEPEYGTKVYDSTRPLVGGAKHNRVLYPGGLARRPESDGEKEAPVGGESPGGSNAGEGASERVEEPTANEMGEDASEAMGSGWPRQIRELVKDEEGRIPGEMPSTGGNVTELNRAPEAWRPSVKEQANRGDKELGGDERIWGKTEGKPYGHSGGATESTRETRSCLPGERKRGREAAEEDQEGRLSQCRRRTDDSSANASYGFAPDEGAAERTGGGDPAEEEQRRFLSKRGDAEVERRLLGQDWDAAVDGMHQVLNGNDTCGSASEMAGVAEENRRSADAVLKWGVDCVDALGSPTCGNSPRDTRVGEAASTGSMLVASSASRGGACNPSRGNDLRDELVVARTPLDKAGRPAADASPTCITDEELQQRQRQQHQQLEEDLEHLAHLHEQARLLGAGEDAALFRELSRMPDTCLPSDSSRFPRDEECVRKSAGRTSAMSSGSDAVGFLPCDNRKMALSDDRGGSRDNVDAGNSEGRTAGGASSGNGLSASQWSQDLPLGVFYTSKKHAYCANWYEGKRQMKRYFPISKLGEEQARLKAIAARREAEQRERESKRKLAAAAAAEAAAAAASCGSGRSNAHRSRHNSRTLSSAHGTGGVGSSSHVGGRLSNASGNEEAGEPADPLSPAWHSGGCQPVPNRSQRAHEDKFHFLQQQQLSQLLDGKAHPSGVWESRFLSSVRRIGMESDVNRTQYEQRWRKAEADDIFTNSKSARGADRRLNGSDRESYGRLSNPSHGSSVADESPFSFGGHAARDARGYGGGGNRGANGPQSGDGGFGNEFQLAGLDPMSSGNGYSSRVQLNGERECDATELMVCGRDGQGW